MKKDFRHGSSNVGSLSVFLDELDLTKEEKSHLLELASDSLHHAILDTILTHLSKKEKDVFLHNLVTNDHDRIWKHLRDNIEGIEEKIKKTAQQVKSELNAHIKETKGKVSS